MQLVLVLIVTIWRYLSPTQYNWDEYNFMPGGQRIKIMYFKIHSVDTVDTTICLYSKYRDGIRRNQFHSILSF